MVGPGETADGTAYSVTMKTRTLAASILTAAALFTMAPAASAAPTGAGSDVAETNGIIKGTREYFCTNFGMFCW